MGKMGIFMDWHSLSTVSLIEWAVQADVLHFIHVEPVNGNTRELVATEKTTAS